MKKGFTLIELLATIVVLSIIAVLVIPAIGKLISGSADAAYNVNIKAIENAAYDWALQNTTSLPSTDGNSVVVYLDELKRTTTIDTNISNPKNGHIFSNNTSVTITKNGRKYRYTVNPIEIGDVNDDGAPILTIGNMVDYVEVNQNGVGYNLVNPTSDKEGARVSYQILENNREVPYVDTSRLSKYTIVYSATFDDKTAMYEKMVIVRDTTKPIISFEDDLECNLSELSSINLLDGVLVTDNSGESIIPTYESNIENAVGTYNIYYSATDSSENTETLVRARLITVR